MERYASAAQKVSRMAVGSMDIPASETVIRLSSDVNQDDYVEGLPLGTRGGRVVRHTFPLDAEYEIRLELLRDGNDLVPSYNDPHTIEVSVDGDRAKLFTFGEKRQPGARGRGGAAGRAGGPGRAGGAGGRAAGPAKEGGDAGIVDVVDPLAASAIRDRDFIARVRVSAGVHDLGLAFVKKSSAYPLTQRQWFLRPVAGIGDTRYEPQLGSITIAGPFNPTGPGDTPSRRRVFICRPASTADERRCGRQILSTFARRAYRRPIAGADLEPLLGFFDTGRTAPGGNFENGRRAGTSPFAGQPVIPVQDRGRSREPCAQHRVSHQRRGAGLAAVVLSLEQHPRRSASRRRGRAGSSRLPVSSIGRSAACWPIRARMRSSRISRGSGSICATCPRHPRMARYFRISRAVFAQAFQRETELFFESILRDEHASVLELLRAELHVSEPATGPVLRDPRMSSGPTSGASSWATMSDQAACSARAAS